MKTTAKYKTAILITTALVLVFACGLLIGRLGSYSGHNISLHSITHPTATVDPHEGQVLINDGFDTVWITPYEDVEVNPFNKTDFAYFSNELNYMGSDYTTLRGVDVSEHQHEINWRKVADAGIDFAMIRVGYRGYTQGGLFVDPFAEANMKGAFDAGIKVGVYFFSQAITTEEAIEEAEFLIDIIKNYKIDMPVIFDWEEIEDNPEARTYELDNDTLNACAEAFCRRIEMAGYEAGIYFNRHIGYYGYDLSMLKDYFFWVSVPGDYPDFYYAADMWQYSFTETVPGIQYENDVNLMFIPVEKPKEAADVPSGIDTVTVTLSDAEGEGE